MLCLQKGLLCIAMFAQGVAMCATDQGALYSAMTVTGAILVYLSSSLFPDEGIGLDLKLFLMAVPAAKVSTIGAIVYILLV